MTSRPRRPRVWLAASATAGSLLLGVGTAPAAAADLAILTHGHIDLFETSYDAAADRLVVQVKDDTRIYGDEPFFRAPEDVVLVVDAEPSAIEIPDFEPLFFLGAPGDTVYLLPMTQDERLPWPGWNSERLGPGLLEGDQFQLDLTIDGPGEVFSFMDDPVGMPIARYVDTTDAAPDRIPVGVGAHAHTNWVFTEVGEYTFVVTASGRKTDGTAIHSEPVTYRIVVGDPPSEEPVVPRIGIEGGTAYDVGDVVTLTAAQNPPTAHDVYDWAIRWPGEDTFEAVSGVSEAAYTFTATERHDGAQLLVSLRDDDGILVATSPIVTLAVDGGPSEPGDAAQRVTVALADDAGALVMSVDPEDDVADLGELALGEAGDRWIADGELRPVTVTDTRSAAPGWQVSGRLSDFVSDDGVLGARHLGWTPRVDRAAPSQAVEAGPAVPAGFEAGDGLASSQVLATSPGRYEPRHRRAGRRAAPASPHHAAHR
ncbi:hypothetical protein E1212_29040 [Jiangella ureilytica]|uniref:Surface-anchored protein n=1 Tax=Jiangella ureilytica TaxID=2530374 RepID=A0A4R4R8G0_9ACTN|nr:choice-of-anchor M domain-containing protein [Jiangella ureilytica]TDC45314.1 hypothetical protein E1212_29040 [Jiangella ureilytica]